MGKKTRDALVNGSRIPARNPEQNAKNAAPTPAHLRLYACNAKIPSKTRKTPPPAPLRGPGPHRLHLVSGRVWSVPRRVAFGR